MPTQCSDVDQTVRRIAMHALWCACRVLIIRGESHALVACDFGWRKSALYGYRKKNDYLCNSRRTVVYGSCMPANDSVGGPEVASAGLCAVQK